MTYQDSTRIPGHREHWQDWINVALAVWFFISPWVLQFGGTAFNTDQAMAAAWNAWLSAIAVFIVALSGANQERTWAEWVNVALGVWIFIAPWVLGFGYGAYPRAAWDHWILGAIVAILGLWSASTTATRVGAR